MSENKSNIEIITQLQSHIDEKKKILSELDKELEILLMKKDLLMVQESNMKQEINEMTNKVKEYQSRCQDLQKVKLLETEWLQTRTQILLENEKVNINYHKSKMEEHVQSWLQNHSNLKEEPEDINEMSSSNVQWNSGMSDDLSIKLEIEAQAAEISLKKAELLENIENEQKRKTMLVNRNKAYHLKLRKDLQKSEANRKEVMKKCQEISENIKKIEKHQHY